VIGDEERDHHQASAAEKCGDRETQLIKECRHPHALLSAFDRTSFTSARRGDRRKRRGGDAAHRVRGDAGNRPNRLCKSFFPQTIAACCESPRRRYWRGRLALVIA
jgi:hypothetical protein